MALDGFGYYYQKYNLSPSILGAYINFNDYETGAPNVFTVETGNPVYYINEIGQSIADDIAGSGYLSGGIFEVNSGDSLEKSDFSALLIFEKKQPGEQILLSTLSQTAGGTSGFVFGINDANKAFVTTFNPTLGFEHHTFETSLGRKNGIALTKDDNNFSLLKFNFFEKEIYEERATFSNACLTQGTGFFIGGMSGVTGLPNKTFTGYIDEFAFIDQPLNSSYISGLFRGMCSAYPVQAYGVTNNTSKYRYQGLTTLRTPEFESITSGALDYIQANIFNTTGVGTITVVSSGHVTTNVAHVSGYLSGYVTLPTGYFTVESGQRVTGYTFSGQVPSATGITGYTLVGLNPFAAYDEDKYLFSGMSGLTGVTAWQDVFSGALYEDYVATGFVATGLTTLYNFPFSFDLSGMSGNCRYVHLARYTNNGNDKIVIQHDLNYSGTVGQTASFRVLKDQYLDYGQIYVESPPDFDFVTGFVMDGVTTVRPIGEDWLLSVDYPNYWSGDYRFNKNLITDYSSGMFKTATTEDETKIFAFANGKQLTDQGSGADYIYYNTYLSGEINYDRRDVNIVDYFSGARAVAVKLASDIISGQPIFENEADNTADTTLITVDTILLTVDEDSTELGPSGFIFVNGQKLISGIDYTGNLIATTNQYSGIGGYKWLITPTQEYGMQTGLSRSLHKPLPERGTLLYTNGIRQKLTEDYVETSQFDLIYNLTGNLIVDYQSIFSSENFII
jgi:hypothetical protein